MPHTHSTHSPVRPPPLPHPLYCAPPSSPFQSPVRTSPATALLVCAPLPLPFPTVPYPTLPSPSQIICLSLRPPSVRPLSTPPPDTLRRPSLRRPSLLALERGACRAAKGRRAAGTQAGSGPARPGRPTSRRVHRGHVRRAEQAIGPAYGPSRLGPADPAARPSRGSIGSPSLTDLRRRRGRASTWTVGRCTRCSDPGPGPEPGEYGADGLDPD